MPKHELAERNVAVDEQSGALEGLSAPEQKNLNVRAEILRAWELPEEIAIVKGKRLDADLVALVTKLHAEILTEFPPPNKAARKAFNCWEHAKGGVPESPQELPLWFERALTFFQGLDPFTRALTVEVFTLAREIERADGHFAGRDLFPHQKALLTWFGMALIGADYREPNRTFLIDSPHGTGKTQILGLINLAAHRALARTESDGVISYVTSRAFTGQQQVVGFQNVRRVALHSYPDRFQPLDLIEITRYVENSFPEFEHLFKRKNWSTFIKDHAEGFRTEKEARVEIIKTFDKGRKLDSGELLRMKPLIDELAIWFSHQGALVRKDDIGNMVMLRFPPAAKKEESDYQDGVYSGDMVRALPTEIASSGLIYSARFPNCLLQKQIKNAGELPSNINPSDLATMAVFSEHDVQHVNRRRAETVEVLKNSPLIIIDEAGKIAAGERQKMAGETDLPRLVVAAVYSKSRFNCFSWDAVTPQVAAVDMFNKGILPGLSQAIHPVAQNPHFRFGTIEALNQVVKAHFTQYPIYKAQSLPFPYEGRTVMVTSRDYVVHLADALQAEYDKREIPGVVVPLSVNTGTIQLDRYVARALAWSAAWNDYDSTKQKLPFAQVLVTQPGAIIDGLDIPNINLTIADPRSMNHDAMLRLMMRASRGHTPQYSRNGSSVVLQRTQGGLVTIHRFLSETNGQLSNFTNIPSSILNPEFDSKKARTDGKTDILQGAIFLPHKLAQREIMYAQEHGISNTKILFGTEGGRIVSGAFLENQGERGSDRGTIAPPRMIQRLVMPNFFENRLSADEQHSYLEFTTKVIRACSDWEEVNQATNSTANKLPLPWKTRWDANRADNLATLRAFGGELTDHGMRVTSRDFALTMAKKALEIIKIGTPA